MSKYGILSVFVSVVSLFVWAVFQSDLSLWTFGFSSGIAVATLLAEIIKR